MKDKKAIILLVIIVFIALFLRLLFVFSFDSYTFDESVSVAIAEKPIGEMWQYLKHEMHPPLHFYFLSFWIKFFGSSEIVVRLLSVIIGIFSTIAIYFLAKENFSNEKSGLFAAFIFSISPFLAFNNAWVRMYGLLFLLSTLSFYFFLKIIKTKKKKYVLFYIVSTIFVLYTHITAPLIILVQVIYLFMLVKIKEAKFRVLLKKFLIPLVLIFVAYIPWFVYFVSLKFKSLSFSAWYFHDDPHDLIFFYNPLKFLVSDNNLITNNLGLFLILVLFSFSFLKFKRSFIDRKLKIKLFFSKDMLLPIILFAISFFSLIILGLYVLRYFIIPALGFCLILAYSLSKKDINKKIKIVLVLVLLIVTLPSFYVVSKSLSLRGWQRTVDYIEENEKDGDKIITALHKQLLPLRRYYKGDLQSDSVMDKSMLEKDLLLTVIKTNYYSSINKKNVNDLYGLTINKDRIFFVFSENDFSNAELAHDWFRINGWIKEDSLTDGHIKVHLFSKIRKY